jgi:hypothetical protein
MLWKIVASLFASLVLSGVLRAQEDSPLARTDTHVHKFDAAMSRMEAYLKSAKSYGIQVMQQWKTDHEKPIEGVNHYRFMVRHPNQFRLEVTAKVGEKNSSLICVGDGKRLTRMFTLGKDCIYSQNDGGLSDLFKDAMTDTTLRDSWLDLVCRSDLHAYAMTTASNTKYVGKEELGGRKVGVFQTDWHSQRIRITFGHPFP